MSNSSNCQHTNTDAEGFCTECGVRVAGGLVKPAAGDQSLSDGLVGHESVHLTAKNCTQCQFACGPSDAVCENCGLCFADAPAVTLVASVDIANDTPPLEVPASSTNLVLAAEPVVTGLAAPEVDEAPAIVSTVGVADTPVADTPVAVMVAPVAEPTVQLTYRIEIHIDPDQYLTAAGKDQQEAVPCPVGVPVRTIELTASETIVGRIKAENDASRISAQDPFVSKEHFKLVVDEAGLHVVPLKSTNETILNGNNVDGLQALKSGDIIQVGGWTKLVIL